MFVMGGATKIYLYRETIDMRKSFERLSEAVESEYPGQLLTGSCFAFLNKRGESDKGSILGSRWTSYLVQTIRTRYF